jgi:hypothetical protein|tara:strand:+ start:166 stop:510 length:345 start_codon:yes stop_codon:yes gene_type:complete
VCGLDAEATKVRFASTQDAAKSHNYCGDAAYVAALLSALGMTAKTQLTMTNKIKEVELVWTLGAMLAKSAELAGGAGSASLLSRALQIGVAGLAVYLLCRCCKVRALPTAAGDA